MSCFWENNSGVTHRLGSTHGEQLYGKEPGVLGDNKFNVSEPCAAVAKQAKREPGCTKKGYYPTRVSTFQDTPRILHSVLVTPFTKIYGQTREHPEKGHKDN